VQPLFFRKKWENGDVTRLKWGRHPFLSRLGLSELDLFLGRPMTRALRIHPMRDSRSATNLSPPAGRPARVLPRSRTSIFSSSFSASHADQSAVSHGWGDGKGDSNGSLRRPQWAAALLQGYSSALPTMRMRTGFRSTYRMAAQRCGTSSGQEKYRTIHSRPYLYIAS
jgi:hypothetical protein